MRRLINYVQYLNVSELIKEAKRSKESFRSVLQFHHIVNSLGNGGIKLPPLRLVKTRLRFGYRRWFQCPVCMRRVRFLYLVGGEYKCRRCHSLKYSCQLYHKTRIYEGLFKPIQRLRKIQSMLQKRSSLAKKKLLENEYIELSAAIKEHCEKIVSIKIKKGEKYSKIIKKLS